MLENLLPRCMAFVNRHFHLLDTASQLVPGYRDSPDPEHEMAIVYVKVSSRAAQCWRICCLVAWPLSSATSLLRTQLASLCQATGTPLTLSTGWPSCT